MDSLTSSLLHLFPPRFCDQRAQRHPHPVCALQTPDHNAVCPITCSIKVNPAEHPFRDFFSTAWQIGNCFLQKLNKLYPFVWLSPLVNRNCSLFFWFKLLSQLETEVGRYGLPGSQQLYKVNQQWSTSPLLSVTWLHILGEDRKWEFPMYVCL